MTANYDGKTDNRMLFSLPSIDKRYGELEYMLLVMLCMENYLYAEVCKSYKLESFMDSGARKIAEKLYGKLTINKSCVLTDLIDELEPSVSSYLVHISETKCELSDVKKALGQLLNRLELLKLEEIQIQTIERIKNEQDGFIRQKLGFEFSKRAERIAELRKMQ